MVNLAKLPPSRFPSRSGETNVSEHEEVSDIHEARGGLRQFMRDLRWLPVILLPGLPAIIAFTLNAISGKPTSPGLNELLGVLLFVAIIGAIIYTAVIVLRTWDRIKRARLSRSASADAIDGRD